MFYNWLNNSPKDLVWVLENKGIEKDRFSGPKCSTGRGYSQLAQLVEEPIDRLPSSGQGPVEGCQKLYLSPSGLLFQVEVILFPARSGRGLVEVRSRTGRGSVEDRSRFGRGNGNLSCIKCSKASEPVDP